MPEVKVLIEGYHKLYPDDHLDVAATTTLIKSDINIVVDPGSFVSKDRLISTLKAEGLDFNIIDAVILTHSHIDHTTNLLLFSKAKIFWRLIEGKYQGQFQKIEEGKVYRYDILNNPIAQGVRIIETPGHAIDSITVLVETDDGIVAIAGDAIAGEEWADLEKSPSPNLVYNLDKYNESRKKILAVADWIIPGHGKMFKVNK